MIALMLAAALISASKGGVELKVESESRAIDPAKSVFLRVEVRSSKGKDARLPDLRDRVKGFSLAEDFVEESKTENDGTLVQAAQWKLIPEPCAKEYKVKPFVIPVNEAKGGAESFYAGPIYFENPPAREPVTGGMEVNPKKDLPPLSWKLVGYVTGAIAALALLAMGLWMAVKYLMRRIKEHRMSPIERAWVELDRLIKKGLPGRGRYKDFYVELTMVVRRYVQRKYGISAPHLTTEEFLKELAAGSDGVLKQNSESLAKFLESADMVKFAGVEATPEMADNATESARGYLKNDDSAPKEAK